MALGGVGEAMLLSAAIGGGTSALTGGDPLKGALLGAATGFIGGGGIADLLKTGATAAEAALPAVTDAAAGATQGLNALQSNLPAGLESAITPSQAAANFGMDPNAINMANQLNMAGNAAGEAATAALTPAQQTIGLEAAQAGQEAAREGALSSLSKGMPKGEISLFDDPLAYLKNNKVMAGSAALAGALGGQRKITPPERKKIEGLPIWAYRAKEGGITSLAGGGMANYDMVVGETPMYARGGVSDLGTFSDGGRMLKGRGDGMSDSIPGVIAGKRPARLADGEFVVPADVVSHLGNGSTDAGAKQLYRMMDKVRAARTGTKKQGRQINPRRFMPA